jgi:DNA-3-methyladenine glycosylase
VAAGKAPHLSQEGPRLIEPLPRSFYARRSVEVARDLLGCTLVRDLPEGRVSGRIVECEAYEEGDPASHSFRGLTDRTAVMFGPPGHLYVYFSYGMHFCMNVVTGRDGEGSAVLLRAVEPLEGIELMRQRRGVVAPRVLCAGPGRLTQAYGVTRANNGTDLVSGGNLFVAEGARVAEEQAGVGPRIGITVATETPWRFYVVGSAYLSRGGAARKSGQRAPRPARATGKGTATGTAAGSARAEERAKATGWGSAGEAGSRRRRSR